MTLCAEPAATNAFDDLKRKGEISSDNSMMGIPANGDSLQKLLDSKPKANYFLFAEDRSRDIRMKDQIPQHWAESSPEQRMLLQAAAAPGEYLTYQIGVFAPYQALSDIQVAFSDLKNEKGDIIKATAMQCFHAGGVNTSGEPFSKKIDVAQGKVQALWMGVELDKQDSGLYKGYVDIKPTNAPSQRIEVQLMVKGSPVAEQGDNEGWRKGRLRWLNSTLGLDNKPTAPYKALLLKERNIKYLGGRFSFADNGLPLEVVTKYTESNSLNEFYTNSILERPMQLIVETQQGVIDFQVQDIRITSQDSAAIHWQSVQTHQDLELIIDGSFHFDGFAHFKCRIKAKKDINIKDIRLEVPYTPYASKYMMGLGHKGGLRTQKNIEWKWDKNKNQDKIWIGNVNAGLNFVFTAENYKRPLVNVYYALGQLNLPPSWANESKGGIRIEEREKEVLLTAYSGERHMSQGEEQHYNFNMLITPVKPLNMPQHATERFYHSNSDRSQNYIAEASKIGATAINIHHKKDVYPFINYPYYDESVTDLKQFAQDAAKKDLDMRLYYTTRELTVKIPELWALHSLNGEVICDGPGKDARTLLHQNGPHAWLNENLKSNFIPAWYNAFNEGKYKGEMDLSVITTPDSRWNNYYLAGLDWMVSQIQLKGVYIDDSALDRTTLQRARRILDKDGETRLIDIHSWNHHNEWAGFANSLHLYLELLPYVDKCWMGEGFPANNSADFWLIEMSGIPFGLLSESLDAHGSPRGMAYAMLPRYPWSGNPKAMWNLWDEFGMKDAELIGYWDQRNPVECESKDVTATLYRNKKTGKTLIALVNWSDKEQSAAFRLKDGKKANIHPATIEGLQDGKKEILSVPAAGGAFFIME